MRTSLSLFPLLSLAAARSVLQQEPIKEEDAAFHFPSVHESAVMARRIMHLTSIGTLVTTFPNDTSSLSIDDSDEYAAMSRPDAVAGSPIGLAEYYADCEPHTGNPTLLAINIATPFRNHAAGSPISMHVRWWPIQKHTYSSSFFSSTGITTPHTPAALPRFSLHGHLEPISKIDLMKGLVPACFMRAHPDSAIWQPGSDVHESQYMRFVVEEVFWFGGFGDRARIQWLPIEEWNNVTMDEVASCRLPGEESSKGWMEWLGLRGDL